MDTKRMLEMADFMDDGGIDPKDFNMANYDQCLLGHAFRHYHNGQHLVKSGKRAISKPAMALFGIAMNDPEWWFLFTYKCSYKWSNDVGEYADRLRYVVLRESHEDITEEAFEAWRKKRYIVEPAAAEATA